MNGLVEFLNARLDEDEQVARNCVGDDLGWLWAGSGGHVKDADGCAVVAVEDYGPEVVEHIARHDPLRTLAEVNAKRLLLAEHADYVVWSEGETSSGEPVQDPDWVCRTCVDRSAPEPWELADARTQPCPTLRILALPYADHPDYRQEWTP